MGPLTNITRYTPHVIQLGFSQKILIILLPKLGRKITFFPHKAQHYLACGQNPKKVQNSKSPTTMWLISKSHYDVANSKTRYDAALFTKPVVTRQYITKSQNHFYKAQIPIWHLFSQGPNSNLALLYKAQNIILATIFTLFHKTQILIWQLS